MPVVPVISDGSPFYGENTPVGAPEPKMSPPRQQRSFGGGGRGGYQGEEKKPGVGGGGGGAGRENACVVFEITPL
jgi:hypothetical protein